MSDPAPTPPPLHPATQPIPVLPIEHQPLAGLPAGYPYSFDSMTRRRPAIITVIGVSSIVVAALTFIASAAHGFAAMGLLIASQLKFPPTSSYVATSSS